MEKVLSLIIPTYNMERYLNKCLDSLIVDNMNLLEVLVINDGSKDNSSEIAHKYERRYPNTFRVIDKENGNYGSCINEGLKRARGKYIKILDADDCFDSKSFNSYLNDISSLDVDLILNDFVTVNEVDEEKSRHSYSMKEYCTYDFKSIYKLLGNQIAMHQVAYKREKIVAMNYIQTEGISYTDQEWIHLPMTTINTIYYINIPLYRYLVGREGQTMEKSVLSKNFKQLNIVIDKLIDNYENYNYLDYKKDYLLKRICVNIHSIYENAILNKAYFYNDFKVFDEKIAKWNPELISEMEDYTISPKIPFKYIKYWRKHYKFIPPYINLLYQIRLFILSIKKN